MVSHRTNPNLLLQSGKGLRNRVLPILLLLGWVALFGSPRIQAQSGNYVVTPVDIPADLRSHYNKATDIVAEFLIRTQGGGARTGCL